MRALMVAVVLAAAVLSAPVQAWDAVACVQAQLNALGYDAGVPDGRPGPASRAALARYEAASGSVTALPFDRHSAIVHCRRIGLRQPQARALWPSASGPFTVHADASVAGAFRAGVTTGLDKALADLDRTMGISLAAPFVVYVGQDAAQILRLAKATLPAQITEARLARALRSHCGQRFPRGVSMPGVIAICGAPAEGSVRGPLARMAQTLVRHEMFHEVQYQLAGDRPPLDDAAWLRAYGPKWLIEGSAMVFEAGPLKVGGAVGAPLAGLERHDDGVEAGLVLYALGQAAASALMERGGGPAALAEFYDLLGRGLAWPAAFERAFGITPADYYAGG